MSPCQTCKFFSVMTQQCRINPPVAIVVGQNEAGFTVIGGMFPSSDGRGCGKHGPDLAPGEIE